MDEEGLDPKYAIWPGDRDYPTLPCPTHNPSKETAAKVVPLLTGVSKKSDEFILQVVDRKQNPGK